VSDYDDLTIHDVMSAAELAEDERDAELRLDAADEERALQADAEETISAGGPDDYDDYDCGAVSPDDECGMCEGGREAAGDDIEAQYESGSISYGEAVDAHVLNGTWG
jgi:hypothetical protein